MNKWIALAVFAFFTAAANAEPFVCLQNPEPNPLFETASWKNPSCETLDNISAGMEVVSFGLAAGGFYAACTGVGAPATLVLEGAALGVTFMDLIVGNLPCDNSSEEEQIKKLAQEAVCVELAKHGIKCSL